MNWLAALAVLFLIRQRTPPLLKGLTIFHPEGSSSGVCIFGTQSTPEDEPGVLHPFYMPMKAR